MLLLWLEKFEDLISVGKKNVTNDMQCSMACRKHTNCQSAIVNESNTCTLRDVNRRSAQVTFKPNPSLRYFERHTCPPSVEQAFIAFVSDVENCKDIYAKGHLQNGIYAIKLSSGVYQPIRCNMVNQDEGGWTIVLRRISGIVPFDKNWETFKSGFGSLDTEFYIGNERFHQLTQNGTQKFFIKMVLRGGNVRNMIFDEVRIGSEAEKYSLNIGDAMTGSYVTSGGKLKNQNDGKKFTTYDQDNDNADNVNCSHNNENLGWWYQQCGAVNLHGVWSYTNGGSPGIRWGGGVDEVNGQRENIEKVYYYIK
ncbi:ficolin-1-like isoform X2 [Clytia hemisphaerica]|uniref:ficolin-1-like isoform X2 n=1 Tax=Clytia hemisphaerica TaxID=252671 RepID=UPI0034D50CA7